MTDTKATIQDRVHVKPQHRYAGQRQSNKRLRTATPRTATYGKAIGFISYRTSYREQMEMRRRAECNLAWLLVLVTGLLIFAAIISSRADTVGRLALLLYTVLTIYHFMQAIPSFVMELARRRKAYCEEKHSETTSLTTRKAQLLSFPHNKLPYKVTNTYDQHHHTQ